MNRKDYTTVPIPNSILAKIDAFLKTSTAIHLGIDSRPSFVIMLTAAFLSKYDEEYKTGKRLFDLDENDLRDILAKIAKKSS